jgi:hypothetical protein
MHTVYAQPQVKMRNFATKWPEMSASATLTMEIKFELTSSLGSAFADL